MIGIVTGLHYLGEPEYVSSSIISNRDQQAIARILRIVQNDISGVSSIIVVKGTSQPGVARVISRRRDFVMRTGMSVISTPRGGTINAGRVDEVKPRGSRIVRTEKYR